MGLRVAYLCLPKGGPSLIVSVCLVLSDEFGQIDWDHLIADGTFCRAKKGGEFVGRVRQGNDTSTMVLMDGDRTPLGVIITAAKEAEVNSIERLLKEGVVTLPEKPGLLYDGAADSDPLCERWQALGVALICPNRLSYRLRFAASASNCPAVVG